MAITRRLDPLGRITIPIEARRNVNLKCGMWVEFYYRDNEVVLVVADNQEKFNQHKMEIKNET